MTSTSNGGVGAFNATVRTNEPYEVAQPAREQRARDLAKTAERIAAKVAAHRDADLPDDATNEQRRILHERETALQTALNAAQDEAKQAQDEAELARVEAQNEVN